MCSFLEDVLSDSPAASSPPVVCVPLLVPLLTLMERSSTTPEGAELWETNDQGCDIMLRHLEAARHVANDAQSYTANAQTLLEGKTRNLNVLRFLLLPASSNTSVCFVFRVSV